MDPIADMLTSIRNSIAVKHLTVEVPFSKLKYEVIKILEKNGFIEKSEKKGRKTKKTIQITLKYSDNLPVILGLRKVSKSGQRIYVGSAEIKKVKGGKGISIISTSKGLMIGKEARKQKLGGEIICEVW